MGHYTDTACKGKKAFRTQRLANTAATRNRDDERRTTYRCKACGQWHIGSESFLETHIVKNYKRVKRYLRDSLDDMTGILID
jgi:hypothetical protein